MNKKILSLILAIVMLLSTLFVLASCDELSAEGKWHKGESTPEETLGEWGDYFFQSTTYDVWKKGDDGWAVIDNIKPADESKEPAEEEPEVKPEVKPDDKIYLAYMGYIFKNKENTGISAPVTLDGNCYENTLSIASSEMSEFFPGEYIDLASSYIALMADYDSGNNTTYYSGTSVHKISLYAKEAGTVKIGAAKVSDIVAAKKNGTAISPTVKTYSVVAGLNTIALNDQIRVGENQTIVIGGAKLYSVSDIPINDECGNYTLLNKKASNTVVDSSTSYEKTLAVSVNIVEGSIYREHPVDANIRTASASSAFSTAVSKNGTPYMYSNVGLYSGKTLTKIGIPVRAVEAINAEQTFTLHVYNVDRTKSAFERFSLAKTYTLKLPQSQLGTDPTTVNKWVYVDLTSKGIVLAENQTLAFGAKTDTVVWGYGAPASGYAAYKFLGITNQSETTNRGIFFDVYFKETETLEQHTKLVKLRRAISGKNISILGDSISTMTDYSSGVASTTTNSTISGNSVWYHLFSNNKSIYAPSETWWYQSINRSNMKLLVNNSWSGDMLQPFTADYKGALVRCEDLHDNTGTNSGTNPDIIAVFFGTNDRNRAVTPANFRADYKTMLNKIKAKYGSADIFVFTLMYTSNSGASGANIGRVEEFNNIIREVAAEVGATVVDVSNEGGINKNNYLELTVDGVHPNMQGADCITNVFLDTLYEKYVK